MLTVRRVHGGARKALLQRRVGQLGSLTSRRDRLLEPDAMALVSHGRGERPRRARHACSGEGPPALRGTTSKATYVTEAVFEGGPRGGPCRSRFKKAGFQMSRWLWRWERHRGQWDICSRPYVRGQIQARWRRISQHHARERRMAWDGKCPRHRLVSISRLKIA